MSPRHVVIHQEEDRVRAGVIAIIAVVTLIVFGIGILWAIWLVVSISDEVRPEPAPIPSLIGQPVIGIVEQPMFDRDRRLADLLGAQRERLSSYGFVDREKGRIHIPIEEAMKRVAAGERP